MTRKMNIRGCEVSIDDVNGEIYIDATHKTMSSDKASQLSIAIANYLKEEGILTDEDTTLTLPVITRENNIIYDKDPSQMVKRRMPRRIHKIQL